MTNPIFLLVLAALALLLIYAATRPDSFCIQRSAAIKAPAPKIYALINDLRSFNNWSPFEKQDPGARGSYSGAASGVGAAYAWAGKKTGTGRMEIIAADAPNRVTMKLDFVKPMKAHNTAEFTLQAQGDNLTIVTWAMHGPSTFVSKLMSVVLNTDTLVGKEFEAGLATLRLLAESRQGVTEDEPRA